MHVLNLVTNPNAQFFEQQVASLADRGIDQRTVSVPGERTTGEESADGRSIGEYLRFYPRVLRHALSGYDVVHANYGLTAPAALAQPTRPVVLSLWGSDLHGEYGWLSRRAAALADAVIVMTEGMAEALDVEAHVIPHGVDRDRFRPMPRAAAREAVGWDSPGKHVLFPYAKGRPVKDSPRAERVVAAVGERLEDPMTLHAVSGVPHDRIPLYMNAADALLLTSRHEGSPNAVKEALACNLPVVATDVGDVAERLAGVTPSHVCPTDRALIDGLTDVLEREASSNGRERVEPLGLDRMAERIEAVYESVQ